MYAEFNKNDNLSAINTIENFSNYNSAISNSYSQQEKDAFNFFGINISNGQITDPNKFDDTVSSPNFLPNYNLVMQAEGNNSNSEVVQRLQQLKIKRDQNKSNTISVLEAKYNNLTAALKQYENDEKQVWQNLNTAKDSNFMKKRESYLIQQKLNRLVNERNMVFNDLTNEYNNLTKYKSNLLKLRDRDEYVKNFQNQLNEKNKSKLGSLDQDILTRRRQSQIDMDQYWRQSNTIYYLKIIFIFLLLAMIPVILAISGKGLNKSSGSTVAAVILIIGALLIIMRYVDNRNRSKMLWQERNFPASFDVTNSESSNNDNSCNNGDAHPVAESNTDAYFSQSDNNNNNNNQNNSNDTNNSDNQNYSIHIVRKLNKYLKIEGKKFVINDLENIVVFGYIIKINFINF